MLLLSKIFAPMSNNTAQRSKNFCSEAKLLSKILLKRMILSKFVAPTSKNFAQRSKNFAQKQNFGATFNILGK